MEVTRSQIVRELQGLWPHLVDDLPNPTNICIPRGDYWKPSREHLETFIEHEWSQYVEALDYDIKRFACTNYSSLFRSIIDIHVIRLVESNKIKYDDMLEWCVMTAWGDRYQGQPTSHSVNLILMEDGLWFFEPQQDRVLWKASSEKDNVHLVIL